MATKEVKEMSIESIKKEIVDNLKNNLYILQYLDDSTCSTIYSHTVLGATSCIYNYDIELEGSYISVEVEEHESSISAQNDHKRYKVIVKIGTDKTKNLDDLAALVKEIIVKLYPNRKNYSNVPIYRKEVSYNTVIHRSNRMITFEIESDTSDIQVK